MDGALAENLGDVAVGKARGPRVKATWRFITWARVVMSNEISTMSPIVQARVTGKYVPGFTPSSALPFTFTVVLALHEGMRSLSVKGSCFSVWFTMRT